MKKYENIKTLTELLKSARQSANLTQAQLAKKLKTKQPSIARAEKSGVGNITFAEKWARACGYTLKFHHISYENKDGSTTSFVTTA